MNSEPWVSVPQIADHIGVSTDMVYKWIKEKDLPAYRIGKVWKFKVAEVDHWIKSNGRKSQHAHDAVACE